MEVFCRGTAARDVKSEHAKQKRQLNDFLSSIAGDVSSALAANPLQIPGLPNPTKATGAASSSTAVAASSSAEGATTKATAAPNAESDSAGVSGGLIVGVVIVALAVLALVGTFVSLFLQHRKKKKKKKNGDMAPFADRASSPGVSASGDPSTSSRNVFPDVSQRSAHPSTAMMYMSAVAASAGGAGIAGGSAITIQRKPVRSLPGDSHHLEKPINKIWEIDGREIPRPQELSAERSEEFHLSEEQRQWLSLIHI